MASMPWGELEDYRQLLQEYEQRTADYERRLKGYEQALATGGDPGTLEQVKNELDQEQPRLEELFRRLEVIRKDLARTRDAVA
jgi:predicted  nucleic acid-binding Zn-ribbon protein